MIAYRSASAIGPACGSASGSGSGAGGGGSVTAADAAPGNAWAISPMAQCSAQAALSVATLSASRLRRSAWTRISRDRVARATRSRLMRVQAERRKREADNVATDKAAWAEHCAIGLMAQALPGAASAAVTEPPPPAPDPLPDAEPQAGPIAEAERYAIIYPQRAALIRSLGGLPAKCDFGPPEADL